MCRNIRTLFNFEPPVNAEEIRAASLQFVRRLAASTNRRSPTKPPSLRPSMLSRKFPAGFCIRSKPPAPPKNREEEAARAKARSAQRFSA